jgi:hypothetical protein
MSESASEGITSGTDDRDPTRIGGDLDRLLYDLNRSAAEGLGRLMHGAKEGLAHLLDGLADNERLARVQKAFLELTPEERGWFIYWTTTLPQQIAATAAAGLAGKQASVEAGKESAAPPAGPPERGANLDDLDDNPAGPRTGR